MSLGFNWRATAGFVTDGAGDSGVLDVDAIDYTYPYTSFANGVTAGYVGGSGNMRPRDRNSGVNARLAGVHFSNSDTAQHTWRVDLAATGGYNITLAIGDANYGTGDDYIELFDNASSLGVLVNKASGSGGGGRFTDANNVTHTSAANWVSNNTPISKTFTSTILKLVIGRGAGSAAAPVMTHLSWAASGGGGGGTDAFHLIPERIGLRALSGVW